MERTARLWLLIGVAVALLIVAFLALPYRVFRSEMDRRTGERFDTYTYFSLYTRSQRYLALDLTPYGPLTGPSERILVTGFNRRFVWSDSTSDPAGNANAWIYFSYAFLEIDRAQKAKHPLSNEAFATLMRSRLARWNTMDLSELSTSRIPDQDIVDENQHLFGPFPPAP